MRRTCLLALLSYDSWDKAKIADQDTVLISALEHYSYCPRQCYLIHVEGVFDETTFTLRGHRAHARVDQRTDRTERGAKVLRGLPIWSERHGLVGRCDAVEVLDGEYRPVEYKVGTRRGKVHASIQAAAQALCLEEMFGVVVQELGIYFISNREKLRLPLTDDLRLRTLNCIEATRQSLRQWKPPVPVADARCKNCSLIDACQPFTVSRCAKLSIEDLFTPFPEANLP